MEIYLTSFHTSGKNINLQKSTSFIVFEFLSGQIRCALKILEDFTEETSRKSQQPHKRINGERCIF